MKVPSLFLSSLLSSSLLLSFSSSFYSFFFSFFTFSFSSPLGFCISNLIGFVLFHQRQSKTGCKRISGHSLSRPFSSPVEARLGLARHLPPFSPLLILLFLSFLLPVFLFLYFSSSLRSFLPPISRRIFPPLPPLLGCSRRQGHHRHFH